ncbi:thiamine-phosphate kinase [Lysobacter xanthus]
MRPVEFDLIERIRRRVVARGDVVLGIGDDAALLAPPWGLQLAVAMDTLNAGVHFPIDTRPADIGWKALAVNLSDLAAMGARPAWCTLSLSLPSADAAWLDAFVDGFSELAAQHDVALVGGDTTRGPLSVCVAVQGFVEPGRALRRAGAIEGDDVWISGVPGEAAGALASKGLGPVAPASSPVTDSIARALAARLDRPTPRVALGRSLAGLATSCIDVSDGLLADLGHVAQASGVAIEIDVDALPPSTLLSGFDEASRLQLQAAGGDDYELAFTAPAALRDAIVALASAGMPLTRIGRVVAGQGASAHRRDGTSWSPGRVGYEHFADRPAP